MEAGRRVVYMRFASRTNLEEAIQMTSPGLYKKFHNVFDVREMVSWLEKKKDSKKPWTTASRNRIEHAKCYSVPK